MDVLAMDATAPMCCFPAHRRSLKRWPVPDAASVSFDAGSAADAPGICSSNWIDPRNVEAFQDATPRSKALQIASSKGRFG